MKKTKKQITVYRVLRDPAVVTHLIPANEECSNHTLFTIGLSDHRLPKENDEFAAAELRVSLPGDWPLDESALAEPRWNWPLAWVAKLVEELRSAEKWPVEPTLMNGDPPVALDENTKMCGWLFLDSGESQEVPDRRTIDIYDLFPIYSEEQLVVRQHGWKQLMKLFEEHGVPQYIDPSRPNTAADLSTIRSTLLHESTSRHDNHDIR